MQGREWQAWLAISLALVLLVFAVFGSSLDNGWIHMDSLTHIHVGATRTLAEIFTEADYFSWYPLTLLSFRAEHALVGMEPFLYHLDNVLLHALVSILVVVFARALLRDGFAVPFLCGALFAVHPLHVESVAWVAERKDLLSVGFYLLALIAWLRYCDRGGGAAYAAALAWVALALLSKSMAVTAPVVMLGIDAFRRRHPVARLLVEKIPFFALAVLASLVNLWAQSPDRSGGMGQRRTLWYEDFGWLERLGTGLDSLVFYTAKTLAPVRLAGWYEIGAVRVGAAEGLLATLGLAVVSLAFLRMPARRGGIAFGVFFFLVTLAPVAKVMPFGGESVYNDRYMYLPSVGFFLAFAIPIGEIAFGRNKRWRAAALGALAVAIGLCIWQARGRAEVYESAETFWSDVVDKYPDSPEALNYLGEHRRDRVGDVASALPLFERAARLRPDRARAFYNLGRVLEMQGDLEGAEAQMLKSIAIEPWTPVPVLVTAGFYARHDRPRDVVSLLERAAERWPGQPRLLFQLGRAYLGLHQAGRARGAFSEVIALDPGHGPAHVQLAVIYHNQGHRPKALHHLERAEAAGQPVDPELARRIRGAGGPVR